jgi:hypothetical protein
LTLLHEHLHDSSSIFLMVVVLVVAFHWQGTLTSTFLVTDWQGKKGNMDGGPQGRFKIFLCLVQK